MSTPQSRRPAGTPSGGQYATKAHPEPGFDLDGDQGDGATQIAPDPATPPGAGREAPADNAAEAWRSAGISRREAKVWELTASFQDPPITPSEAAEWSRRMRVIQAGSWRGAGFTVDDAAAWSNAGFAEPADAIRWIREGIGEPDTAKGWQTKGFAAPEARSWVDNGFGTATALRWSNAGFSPSEAAQACRGGRFDPSEVDAGGW